jgi:hypothetical protein
MDVYISLVWFAPIGMDFRERRILVSRDKTAEQLARDFYVDGICRGAPYNTGVVKNQAISEIDNSTIFKLGRPMGTNGKPLDRQLSEFEFIQRVEIYRGWYAHHHPNQKISY